MRIAFLVVLALSVPVMGQVSTEEATARLRAKQERERTAATQPATRLDRAKAGLDKARQECQRKLEESSEYKSAMADLVKKQGVIESAKNSKDSQATKIALDEFFLARKKLLDLKATAQKKDLSIRDAITELAEAQKESDSAERSESARRKQLDYLRNHPKFAALREKMDQLKSAPSDSSQILDYAGYSQGAEKAIAAATILCDYLHDESGGGFDFSEYSSLARDANKIVDSWETNLSEREKEYPSRDLIVKAMGNCASAGIYIPSYNNSSDSSKTYEARGELDTALVENEFALNCMRAILDARDRAEANLNNAKKMLLTKEGAKPIVGDN